MYLEAVTVCSGYADFLRETLRYNQGLFDRWLIVTTEEDRETRDLCRQHGLEVLVTDDFTRNGDAFNKGRAIALGVDLLSQRDWVLHLDADIVLPKMTRPFLETAHLDPQCMHGVDRALIRGWEQWQEFQRSDWLEHSYHYACDFPKGLPLGTRWVSTRHGYCPIGAFQLWHGPEATYHGSMVRRYPAAHNTAARTDIQMALQWNRRQRVLLPELIAIHLESEPCKLGANWKGRATKRFGPLPGAKPEKPRYC